MYNTITRCPCLQNHSITEATAPGNAVLSLCTALFSANLIWCWYDFQMAVKVLYGIYCPPSLPISKCIVNSLYNIDKPCLKGIVWRQSTHNPVVWNCRFAIWSTFTKLSFLVPTKSTLQPWTTGLWVDRLQTIALFKDMHSDVTNYFFSVAEKAN